MLSTARTPILALVCLAVALHAQPPSNWKTVTLPANQASAPNSIGTTVSFLTSNSVWLFSGITKEWTVLPVANPTPIFQANDYCIIQDGNRIHGYASHTGKVETITTTSGNPTIVSGPSSSSWVTLVADGTQAFGFGAFHGRWESIPLSQPNPTMVSNRLIGLLRDGNTVWGLSAHHGTFVPVAADASAVLTVVGEAEVGTAHSSNVFRAFSAQQNNWGVQVLPGTTGSLQQNEFAMVWSGAQIWAFSGLTGTLDTYTASGPIAGVNGAEGVAAFVDGGNVVCYGSGRGRFVTRPAAGASFYFEYHFLLVTEPGLMTPFSALTGTFGPTIVGPAFTTLSNDAIAYVETGAGAFAYSPILNAWTQAPGVTQLAIGVVRDAVVLVHTAGYTALSARHGTWVPITTAVTNNFMAPNTGATFVALDGPSNQIAHVFDARLNRWATITGQAPLTVRISRHTAMAHDGQYAYGFGQPSGEWYTEPLNSPPSRFDTASSIGTVTHATEISVYSVQGSFSYTGRYPEFTQAINLGNTLPMHQVAPPGSALVLLFGARPARIDLGPTLGRLYIDPALLLPLAWPQPVDADGILDMNMAIPNDPALVGSQPQMQNIVLPPSGTPWLSSSVAPVLF